MTHSIWMYLLVMSAVTLSIRILPLTLIRRLAACAFAALAIYAGYQALKLSGLI